ncbi:carbonic anhydrase 14 [Colossoma macropomum]|uniref:carbonic anhydrase 14 n=1 Tax=Colossoma macropomum TaxID=42526 RepID=UPI001864C14D|nr:carbonic anhydrase 14 [Colossoma macropomum]
MIVSFFFSVAFKAPPPGDECLSKAKSVCVYIRVSVCECECGYEDFYRLLNRDEQKSEVMLLKLFIILFLTQNQVLAGEVPSSSSEEDGSSEHDDEEHDRSSSHDHHWGYHDQEAWMSTFQDCSGKSQSPIDIETSKAIYDPSLPLIELDGYDLTGSPHLTLLNNGHTLLLALPNTMRIVKGFDEVYLAAQLHFHWGTIAVPGSEHTIDNVHFPAEIHVVHYNSKYASMSEAANKPDGLAVLGGFIGIGLHENENYEKILSALTDVSIEESNTQIPGFNVRHLLPNNLERFYRYNGSLTTPPCFQTVNWTMFNDTITVSRKQLAALENTLKAGQNQHLSKNFRAPQLLHGRLVLSSFSSSASVDNRIADVPLETETFERSGASGASRAFGGLSRGDILAIAFGALFAVTLLVFSTYAYQQRKKHSKLKKDTRQNVIYKPGTKEEV